MESKIFMFITFLILLLFRGSITWYRLFSKHSWHSWLDTSWIVFVFFAKKIDANGWSETPIARNSRPMQKHASWSRPRDFLDDVSGGWLPDGCWMCWENSNFSVFGGFFFGVEGKDAKRFLFGTYKNLFAHASIWHLWRFGVRYRSFFLNISHPFWVILEVRFELLHKKMKSANIYISKLQVFWCSRFLDFVEEGDPFFLHLTFWTMIWITNFSDLTFHEGKNMVKHLFFLGINRWNFANHPKKEIHTPLKLTLHPWK